MASKLVIFNASVGLDTVLLRWLAPAKKPVQVRWSIKDVTLVLLIATV